MEIVTCPNCGNEIHVRFFAPKSITCRKCRQSFVAEYEDENGELHPGGLEGFKAIHPKITKAATTTAKAAVLVLTAVGIGMVIKDELDKLTAPPEISSSHNSGTDTNDQSFEPIDNSLSSEEPPNYETKTISVTGGLVNLPYGKHPSQEKRDTAAANGYPNLGESQTWRVNHDRNIKVSAEDSEETA